MTEGNTTAGSAAAEILAHVESWAAAVRAGDLDRITAHYHPGIVAYDAILALQFEGLPAYRDHWRMCLGFCENMTFEPTDPRVRASGDLGTCHALVRCGGVDGEGREQSGYVRMTACFERGADGWKTVHEHFSVPFDMASGKALLELKPGSAEAA